MPGIQLKWSLSVNSNWWFFNHTCIIQSLCHLPSAYQHRTMPHLYLTLIKLPLIRTFIHGSIHSPAVLNPPLPLLHLHTLGSPGLHPSPTSTTNVPPPVYISSPFRLDEHSLHQKCSSKLIVFHSTMSSAGVRAPKNFNTFMSVNPFNRCFSLSESLQIEITFLIGGVLEYPVRIILGHYRWEQNEQSWQTI